MTKKIKNYDNKDGLANYEFSYNAGIFSQNNKLIFGGIKLLLDILLGSKMLKPFIPPVVIDNIEISNDTLFHIGKKNRLIELTAHQNTFKINFIYINFKQSQKKK